MSGSDKASELAMNGASAFHCADEYTYYEVKDRLQNGVETLEEALDVARSEDVPQEHVDTLETVVEFARDVAEAERPLNHAQSVQDIMEFGLAWYISDPEECPGFAPEVDRDLDRIGIDLETADL